MITFLADTNTSPGVFSTFGCAITTFCVSSLTPTSFFICTGAAFIPPRRILIRLRFIALHIICVNNKPEAPTIPPTATKKISLIAIPAMAPATPEREFRSEIVMGMSAPPTRTEKYRPNREEVRTVPKTHHPMPVPAVVPIQIKKTVATNRTRVMTE